MSYLQNYISYEPTFFTMYTPKWVLYDDIQIFYPFLIFLTLFGVYWVKKVSFLPILAIFSPFFVILHFQNYFCHIKTFYFYFSLLFKLVDLVFCQFSCHFRHFSAFYRGFCAPDRQNGPNVSPFWVTLKVFQQIWLNFFYHVGTLHSEGSTICPPKWFKLSHWDYICFVQMMGVWGSK